MAIGDDFTIDYVNKRVYHSSGTTVYSANALYSYLQDTFDEMNQMDDDVPMSAQTPTAYSLINGWFINDSSMQYLLGGAITTSGNGTAIRIIQFGNSYTDAVTADITKAVLGGSSADTGVLLDYNNTTRTWYVRPTVPASDLFASVEVVEVTTDGGTGTGTSLAASTTGESVWANLFTLGTIESTTAPQIYIYQSGSTSAPAGLTGRLPILEWSSLTNWDRGQIDVLIKVQQGGTLIDSGNVTVFARQYADLYDHFTIDLSAGGRNAVPLGTADDLNNTTAAWYLLWDAGATAGAEFEPVAGNIVSGSSSGTQAEVIAIQDDGAVGYLSLGRLKGNFSNAEKIGIFNSANGRHADVNGYLGDTLITSADVSSITTIHQKITGGTSSAERYVKGVETTGAEYIVARSGGQVSGSTAPFTAYTLGDVVTGTAEGSVTTDAVSTTLVGGYTNIDIAFVNAKVEITGGSGTFVKYENVTWLGAAAEAGSGIFLDLTGTTMTLANVSTNTVEINGATITGADSAATRVANADFGPLHTFDEAFEQQSAFPYDVHVDCKLRTLAQVYEYFKFINGEDSQFATYPSGSVYGYLGQSISTVAGEEYIIPFASYTPIKASPFGSFAGGTLFGAQGVWVENMASADSQAFQLIDSNGTTRNPPNFVVVEVITVVAGDRVSVFLDDGAGAVDKNQFTSHATLNTLGAGTFEITTSIPSDTPSSGSIRAVERDAGGDIVEEIRYGYESWTGSIFTLGTAGGGYTLNTAYNTNDTAYVGYLDDQASTTVVTNTVIYASDRTVIVRVRLKGIIPFESPGTINTGGMSVAAIRTPDGIVT